MCSSNVLNCSKEADVQNLGGQRPFRLSFEAILV